MHRALAVRSFLFLWLICSASTAQQPELQWIEKSTFQPLKQPAFAYDTRRRVAVVHGGFTIPGTVSPGDVEDATWEWDGASWTRRDPQSRPPNGYMAYDSSRGRVVLFSRAFYETWEWDGAEWMLRAKGSPAIAGFGLLCFDAARGLTLLVEQNSVYGWDGSSWAFLGQGGPTQGFTMYPAYDSERQLTVAVNQIGELWEWDGAAWTSRGTPAPSFLYGRIAYDEARSVTVFVAATTQGLHTGEWDGETWTGVTQEMPAGFPAQLQAIWFDAERQKVVMVGGEQTLVSALGDNAMREWDGTSWNPFWADAAPTSTVRPMTYDGARERVLMYGDQFLGSSEFHEWGGERWEQLSSHPNPGRRRDHVFVYDAARQQTLLFGGDDGRGTLWADTWTWDGAGWTQLTPSTSPPAMRTHCAAYDALRERVVVFGAGDETWEWDGSDWQQVFTTQMPQGLNLPRMAYDKARGQMVLFGVPPTGATGQTWAYDGVDWQQLSPANSPPGRWFHAMAYDEQRGRVVVLGGINADSNSLLPDTWEWNGMDWAMLSYPDGPDAEAASMAYDATRGHMVLFESILDAVPFQRPGETWIYGSVVRAESRAYGRGCEGVPGELRLTGVGRPAVGVEGYRVELLRAPGGSPSALLLGTAAGQGQLLRGCGLWIDPTAHFATLPATVNDAGVARYPLALPPGEAFPGMQLFAQAIVFDRGVGQLTTSHGLRIVSGY